MQKLAIAGLLISLMPASYAAEALIVGEGEVLASPDYVELSIFVDAKCYPTAAEARKVTDDTSRKIVDFLNSKIKKTDNYNYVVSNGGYTSPYETFYQDKYYCQDTFQKQNVITFRTQDVKNFESLYNEIQNMVYGKFTVKSPSVIESSISYVTMSNPTPGVSNEQQEKFEQSALSLAFANAQSKLFSLFGKDKIQNLKLVQASEIPPSEPEPQPLLRTTQAPMAMAGISSQKRSAPAPVQFEQQAIHKTVYFKFSFDDVSIK